VSDRVAEILDPALGLLRPLAALERERPRDHADRECAELLAGQLAQDRRPAGAGAAALAPVTKTMSAPFSASFSSSRLSCAQRC